jgi:prevent-host-death family protein
MRSVGVRELRQRASEYLRLVEKGETFEVTDRGRPIALLVPIPEDPLERLIAEGKAKPPKRRWNIADIVPFEPRPGDKPLSQILQEMRDDERY